MFSTSPGTGTIHAQVRGRLSSLVRKEDSHLFAQVTPAGHDELIRSTWYGIFDPSTSERDHSAHRNVIRQIFDVYCKSNPTAAAKSTDYIDTCEFTNAKRKSMLSLVKISDQVIIPIMMDGILAAAFVYAHLARHGITPDVAFVGCTRVSKKTKKRFLDPSFYKPGRVYIPEHDIEILKRNKRKEVLLVDSVFDTGRTMHMVATELNKLGITKFNFTFLEYTGNIDNRLFRQS